MAYFGIGLGGFATGLDKGVGIGTKLYKAGREADIDKSLDEAVSAGKAEHEAAVEQGTAKAGDADSILRFTMPKLVAPMIRAKNFEGARTAAEWLRSDTTRQATDAWGQGMLLSQTGDMPGAAKKFVEAARIKGYGPDLQLDEPEVLPGGGVRISFKTPDGRTGTREFKTPQELGEFGANALNPAKAFETWQEQRQRQEKIDDTLKIVRGSKQIETEELVKRRDLGVGTKDEMPADARMIEYLVKNGVVKDRKEGAEWVKSAKDSPTRMRMQLIAAGIRNNLSATEAAKQADEVFRLLSAAERAPGIGQGGAAPNGNLTGPGKTITGVKVENAPIPSRPPSVPPGSAYSPSRQMWRSPDGKIYDAQGKLVKNG